MTSNGSRSSAAGRLSVLVAILGLAVGVQGAVTDDLVQATAMRSLLEAEVTGLVRFLGQLRSSFVSHVSRGYCLDLDTMGQLVTQPNGARVDTRPVPQRIFVMELRDWSTTRRVVTTQVSPNGTATVITQPVINSLTAFCSTFHPACAVGANDSVPNGCPHYCKTGEAAKYNNNVFNVEICYARMIEDHFKSFIDSSDTFMNGQLFVLTTHVMSTNGYAKNTDPDVFAEEFAYSMLPSFNPQRKHWWSAPYLDHGQNGLFMTVTVPVDIGSYYWGFFVVDIVAHPFLMNTMTAATGLGESDAKTLHLLVHVSGAIVTADDAAWRELFGEAGAPAEVHDVHSLEEVPATLFDFSKLLEAMSEDDHKQKPSETSPAAISMRITRDPLESAKPWRITAARLASTSFFVVVMAPVQPASTPIWGYAIAVPLFGLMVIGMTRYVESDVARTNLNPKYGAGKPAHTPWSDRRPSLSQQHYGANV